MKTLESALQFALQIETAHQASKNFSNTHPHTPQSFPSALTSVTMPTVTPGYLPTTQVSLGVNSASSDDFRMMQKTIERLSDTVEQLQLEVRQQRREDLDLRRRNSPDQRYVQRNSIDIERVIRRYRTPEGHRESSYDRATARRGHYRASPHQSDRQERREVRARSGSHERYARGYSPSPRDYTRRGRSPERREDISHHQSPGRVRFRSPSHAQSSKVNYM